MARNPTRKAAKGAAPETAVEEPQEAGASPVREVTVPAVARATAILRVLSRSPTPLGVNQIARKVEIIPSTCLHILRALAVDGLVQFDPDTKHYALGLGILNLARAVLRGSLAEYAKPFLDGLVRKHSVTCITVSLSGAEHFVVTGLSHGANSVRLHVDLGSRFPALISATGRCVAAYSGLSEKQLESGFRRLNWHAAPTYDRWKREVAQVHLRGYAIDDGNYLEGITIVAAPILDNQGKFRHAIVGVGIRERLQGENLSRLAHDLRDSAAQIAEASRSIEA